MQYRSRRFKVTDNSWDGIRVRGLEAIGYSVREQFYPILEAIIPAVWFDLFEAFSRSNNLLYE